MAAEAASQPSPGPAISSGKSRGRVPPAPLTFEARVRHLLHVLLDQAALGAHLAAQVTLYALPGCGDAGEGAARPGAGPAGPPRAPGPSPELRGLLPRSPS